MFSVRLSSVCSDNGVVPVVNEVCSYFETSANLAKREKPNRWQFLINSRKRPGDKFLAGHDSSVGRQILHVLRPLFARNSPTTYRKRVVAEITTSALSTILSPKNLCYVVSRVKEFDLIEKQFCFHSSWILVRNSNDTYVVTYSVLLLLSFNDTILNQCTWCIPRYKKPHGIEIIYFILPSWRNTSTFKNERSCRAQDAEQLIRNCFCDIVNLIWM